MESTYDIFKFDINNLNYMTELLEACNWDEQLMESQLQTIHEILKDTFDKADIEVYESFDVWLDEVLITNLTSHFIYPDVVSIIKKVIINRKNEILAFMNTQEN